MPLIRYLYSSHMPISTAMEIRGDDMLSIPKSLHTPILKMGSLGVWTPISVGMRHARHLYII